MSPSGKDERIVDRCAYRQGGGGEIQIVERVMYGKRDGDDGETFARRCTVQETNMATLRSFLAFCAITTLRSHRRSRSLPIIVLIIAHPHRPA